MKCYKKRQGEGGADMAEHMMTLQYLQHRFNIRKRGFDVRATHTILLHTQLKRNAFSFPMQSEACAQALVTRHTSHVTRNRGTRHTSHVTRHTSHVARHTSHVTRHTSHVTRCRCCSFFTLSSCCRLESSSVHCRVTFGMWHVACDL